MFQTFSKTTKTLGFFIGVIAISLSLSYLVLAWTEPPANPPNSNVSTPLNIGPTGQSKSGGLILNTGGAATGLIVELGNVGIGTTNPTTGKLVVSGGDVDVTNNKIINVKNPTLNTDAATMGWVTNYVNAAGSGGSCYTNFGQNSCAAGWTKVLDGYTTVYNMAHRGTGYFSANGPICSSITHDTGGIEGIVTVFSYSDKGVVMQNERCAVCCK